MESVHACKIHGLSSLHIRGVCISHSCDASGPWQEVNRIICRGFVFQQYREAYQKRGLLGLRASFAVWIFMRSNAGSLILRARGHVSALPATADRLPRPKDSTGIWLAVPLRRLERNYFEWVLFRYWSRMFLPFLGDLSTGVSRILNCDLLINWNILVF